MHVAVNLSRLQGNLKSLLQGQLYVFLHMQDVVQGPLADVLKDNDDFRDRWHNSHQQSDVWVPQDALHNYLVLNLLEQIFSDVRVKNLLYGYWCSVELTFVYYRKTSLTDLFIEV